MSTQKRKDTKMTENEFLLQDRLAKIRSTIAQYGEENFFVSFSGGKDSTVLSALIDMALPGNRIPRVFANTGIEYNMIVDFVKKVKDQPHAWELIMLQPKRPIKETLNEEGYPFKSKEHAAAVASYQIHGNKDGKWIQGYLAKEGRYACPNLLRYQFTDEVDRMGFKISDKCCYRLKEEPLKNYQKENKRPYGILGLMREEGGRRNRTQCLRFKGGKFKNFQPMAVVTKDWEEWFIETYHVEICDIYKEPYSLERTGCKGCPFNPHLQKDLEMLKEKFPSEYKQCEIIWKPVYEEYRRIGYRLKNKKKGDGIL